LHLPEDIGQMIKHRSGGSIRNDHGTDMLGRHYHGFL
jgi:hypothetical protein